MTTSLQVLSYLKAVMPEINNTQAMKLLYYSQAWSLTWTGRRAFSDPVIAWQFGPAIMRAHNTFLRVRARSYCLDQTPEVKATVDSVLRYYGHMSASELRDLSHSESPWKNAYNAADGGHEARNAISEKDMKREYTMQAMNGLGPTKPRSEDAVVGRSKFEAILDKVRAEDREALDILATR